LEKTKENFEKKKENFKEIIPKVTWAAADIVVEVEDDWVKPAEKFNPFHIGNCGNARYYLVQGKILKIVKKEKRANFGSI